MATQSTPILRDNTLSSVNVTEIFVGGDLFIRTGAFGQLIADQATFDNLNVDNLIINGTSTGVVSNQSLGLKASELVATDASGAPVSFPYGSIASDIAIRDAAGSISFVSWAAPVNDTQLYLAPAVGQGTVFVFNSFGLDAHLVVPDVGADANLVAYGNNGLSNVIVGGDNILQLKSTDNVAGVILSSPGVTGTRESLEFAIDGTVYAKFVGECDTKNFTIRDGADAVHLQITPSTPIETVSSGQPIVPMTSDAWGLSNGTAPRFTALYTTIDTKTTDDLVTPFTFAAASACVITLNTGGLTVLSPNVTASVVWTNPLLASTSKVFCTVQGLSGALNASGVGVPYVWASNITTGSVQLNTANIGSQSLAAFVTVGILILP